MNTFASCRNVLAIPHSSANSGKEETRRTLDRSMLCYVGFTLLASLLTGAASCSESPGASGAITVPPNPDSLLAPGCPNEPANYTRINDQPWDAVPLRPGLPLDPSGWLDDHRDAATKVPIISDPTSPFPSPNHNVAAGTFP